MVRIIIAAFALAVGIIWPIETRAQTPSASIRLVVPAGLVRVGDIIPIQIQLDSAGLKINAAEVAVTFNPVHLEILFVGREQSMFTLWPELPAWSSRTGTVTMAGGRPGGIYAVNGSIATVYARALRAGRSALDFDLDVTAAYEHDGRGTRLPLSAEPVELQLGSDLIPVIQLVSTTHPTPEYWSYGTTAHVGWEVEPNTEYSYAFGTDPVLVPDDTPDSVVGSVEFTDLTDGVYVFAIKQRSIGGAWSTIIQRRFLIDQTPPNPFSLVLIRPSLTDRRTLVTWNTIDDTSGLAAFTLRVGRQRHGAVTSPLLVKPEWRGQVLEITATDAAGHDRVARLRLEPVTGGAAWPWWILVALLVPAVVIARRLWVSSR